MKLNPMSIAEIKKKSLQGGVSMCNANAGMAIQSEHGKDSRTTTYIHHLSSNFVGHL